VRVEEKQRGTEGEERQKEREREQEIERERERYKGERRGGSECSLCV
jgi:hypothetical protein